MIAILSYTIVAIPNQEKKARIEVLMKFTSPEDASNAQNLLKKRMVSSGQSSTKIEMVDEAHCFSIMNPRPKYSMEKLVLPSTKVTGEQSKQRQVLYSRGESTLRLGNIPRELLEDKAEIIAKFSKYGQIIDIRIRESNTSTSSDISNAYDS